MCACTPLYQAINNLLEVCVTYFFRFVIGALMLLSNACWPLATGNVPYWLVLAASYVLDTLRTPCYPPPLQSRGAGDRHLVIGTRPCPQACCKAGSAVLFAASSSACDAIRPCRIVETAISCSFCVLQVDGHMPWPAVRVGYLYACNPPPPPRTVIWVWFPRGWGGNRCARGGGFQGGRRVLVVSCLRDMSCMCCIISCCVCTVCNCGPIILSIKI